MRIKINHRYYEVPALPLLAGLIVVVMLFMTMRLGRIDASEVGVMINNLTGKVTVKTKPGSFFYNGIYTDLYTLNKTMHTLEMRGTGGVKIKTVEGADVELDVEINYRLLLDPNTIVSKVVPESGVDKFREGGTRRSARRRRRSVEDATQVVDAYRYKWIRDYSRSIVRRVFGSLTTGEFYKSTARDDKAQQCVAELNKLLSPHGLEILKVVPDDFRFYKEYQDNIDEKNRANQEVEREKIAAKSALAQQDKETVEATKAAEVEIEKIKGTLEKQKIEAEANAVQIRKGAEAYGYTTKIGADAEFYQAERQAKGILAAAKAEAESLTNLVSALAGDGGRNLVLRELANALQKARIEGLPYATSPVVQRLSLEGSQNPAKGGGK